MISIFLETTASTRSSTETASRSVTVAPGEVLYESTLTSNQQNYKDKKYFEIAEESFKGRLYNHNLSFRNEFYKNDTELSKEL